MRIDQSVWQKMSAPRMKKEQKRFAPSLAGTMALRCHSGDSFRDISRHLSNAEILSGGWSDFELILSGGWSDRF